MKLSVNRDVLADAVAWAARAISQRPTTPVLAGLVLDARDDTLTLSAFDYDVSARATVEAAVAEPGRALIPGRVLAELAKNLPNQDVYIAASETVHEVEIRCGGAEFGLPTMPLDDYPTLPESPKLLGTVDAGLFRAAISQVFPATSHDDTLPMLTGIRFDIDGTDVSLGATDRYRIAGRAFTWDSEKKAQAGIVIPGKVLHEISRGLGSGPVQVGLDKNMASFACDGRTTTVRLLDNQFVDYRARLDIECPIWAEVEVAPFLAATKRVALMAERNTAVRLAFTDGELTIRAGGGDIGRGSETIPAVLDGEPIEIAFQPQYLLDALVAAAVDGERVRIGMESPKKAALVVPAGDAPAFRELVMSLRLA